MEGKNGKAAEDQNKTEALQKTLEEFIKLVSSSKEEEKNDCIEVHQKALDDLVNVNSLFTIAVFVGLAYASPNQRSLESRPECDPDHVLGKQLIVYEVNAFACFLLSSLVAKSIKVLLNIKNVSKEARNKDHRFLPDRLCKAILLSEPWTRISLAFSVLASFGGIVMLTLSMVNVIQIRVGKLTCGSEYALRAVTSLCVIVFIAMIFYVPSMLYAVIVTSSACKNDHEETDEKAPKDSSSGKKGFKYWFRECLTDCV